MGADIHSRVEVKENGVWKLNTEEVFENQYYYTPEQLAEMRERYKNPEWEPYGDNTQFLAQPSDGRNYDWFAILADVRNGRGFAGVKTGDGFVPIAEPRGVPEDATQEWKEYVEQWKYDMHSQSWLTLKDFEEYDWDRDSIKQGIIHLEEYVKLRGTNGCPESWSGGISGNKIYTLSQAAADNFIDGIPVSIPKGGGFLTSPYDSKQWQEEGCQMEVLDPKSLDEEIKLYVAYRWTVTYKEWFSYKIKEYIEPMRKLAEKYEDVRLVFGFDN
jgi:hypothetical protein